MLAQLKSTSFEWGESSDPGALASSALTLATRICLNILLLSNARIDTDKYFFDSDGCTRTCSIISTQYVAGGMVFFVSLNGFSRLVNVYAHKHSVKLSIVCCTVQVRQYVSRNWSGPSLKSPIVLLVCVCTCWSVGGGTSEEICSQVCRPPMKQPQHFR